MFSHAQSPKASKWSLQASSNIAPNCFVHFVNRLITIKHIHSQTKNTITQEVKGTVTSGALERTFSLHLTRTSPTHNPETSAGDPSAT
jgi:hypothetical protein